MSIDERLRMSLRPPTPEELPMGADMVPALVDRVRRRRRVRVVGVSAVAAAVCLTAFALPRVFHEATGIPEPAVSPTSTPTSEPTPSLVTGGAGYDYHPPPLSPINGRTWTSISWKRSQRLATLEGTGLQAQAPGVFERGGFAGRASTLTLDRGRAVIRVGINGHPVSDELQGTFTVSHHLVRLDLAGSGTAVLRWSIVAGEHLRLTYVDSSGPDHLGAPLEVFIRMALTDTLFGKRVG